MDADHIIQAALLELSQDNILQGTNSELNFEDGGSIKSRKNKSLGNNIFGKTRSISRPIESNPEEDELSIKIREERLEREFEKKC